MKDTDSSVGIALDTFNRKCTFFNLNSALKSDGTFVSILRRAGAIPFVKTNIMQSLCGYESRNPVFGNVSNPWDAKRTGTFRIGYSHIVSWRK
jgi:hypothetical protein